MRINQINCMAILLQEPVMKGEMWAIDRAVELLACCCTAVLVERFPWVYFHMVLRSHAQLPNHARYAAWRCFVAMSDPTDLTLGSIKGFCFVDRGVHAAMHRPMILALNNLLVHWGCSHAGYGKHLQAGKRGLIPVLRII